MIKFLQFLREICKVPKVPHLVNRDFGQAKKYSGNYLFVYQTVFVAYVLKFNNNYLQLM